MTATKRRPRAKQATLPGMEPISNKKVDAAAELYYDAMMERTKLSKEEHEAATNLIETMKEAGLERYLMPDGRTVTLLGKTKVVIKKKKEPGGKRRRKAEANGQPGASIPE